MRGPFSSRCGVGVVVANPKAAVRAQVKAGLAALAPARRALEEELVTAAIQATPEWRGAGTVLLYRSAAPEITTVGLALAGWRAGKRLLFPRVVGLHTAGRPTASPASQATKAPPLIDGPDRPHAEAGEAGLTLHACTGWHDFASGAYGLLEPAAHCPQVPPEQVELAIIPGVAWDAQGGRVGRGGGYYDRLLPTLTCPTWGIGFDAQVVETVPREGHDVHVTRVWAPRLL